MTRRGLLGRLLAGVAVAVGVKAAEPRCTRVETWLSTDGETPRYVGQAGITDEGTEAASLHGVARGKWGDLDRELRMVYP